MSSASATRFERFALFLLQLGALATVLIALPFKQFDLDRFFVPKELALHATAVAVVLLCLACVRRLELTRVDTLLAGFLVLSAISAAFAPNWWLAERALAVSVSGIALFWAARALSGAGLARPLVAALALAVVAGACTALLQAYGVDSDLVSLNRAPGGTFGNRNFMAHAAAMGMPALILCTFTARRRAWALAGTVGVGLLACALILSRSRAAWVALLVGTVPLALVAWMVRRRWRDARTGTRLKWLALAVGVGVLAAVSLPNTLDWRSDSPYLDSMVGMVNYNEGSGRGRLIQYRNSLHMARAHPWLGVGTGNWSVEYPRFAARNDPSISHSDGMTANPWPSSDWAAFVSERGVPAVALLVLALMGLAVNAVRQMRHARDSEQYLAGLALGATVVVTVAVAAFDAVLLLPATSIIAWPMLGALSATPERTRAGFDLCGRRRTWTMIGVLAIGVLFAARSASQIVAMSIASSSSRLATIEQASRADPGSYRLHMQLAESYARRGACGSVRRHAGVAHDLYPHAPEPRRLLAECRRGR
ncbi:MAG TPA: O-antigen ligase family protein [Gemmatimonadaceae bacterium]|nr:O-antigen ligase family protein [Gemmatimonadaceae bacterium]